MVSAAPNLKLEKAASGVETFAVHLLHWCGVTWFALARCPSVDVYEVFRTHQLKNSNATKFPDDANEPPPDNLLELESARRDVNPSTEPFFFFLSSSFFLLPPEGKKKDRKRRKTMR